jgi:putative ABC transport system substrate-binding protein
VRDAGEIECAVAAFVRGSTDGLTVLANALTGIHRELIITLAARHRLPAVYRSRHWVVEGGLISYRRSDARFPVCRKRRSLI